MSLEQVFSSEAEKFTCFYAQNPSKEKVRFQLRVNAA